MRSAPLPEPAELAAYNAIIPNAADRILKMAESQTDHRIEIETTVVNSQANQAFRGQLFGLFIGLAGLISATYAATHGHDWFGGIIGGGTLVSLVWAFLSSRERQTSELAEKRKQMEPARFQKKKQPSKSIVKRS